MTPEVPFHDPEHESPGVEADVRQAVQRVISSGRYVLGREVEVFEARMADYLGAKHAVGVSSGSDALVMALLACDVRPGDEVVTAPFSFVATAEAILRVGAIPLFVDVSESSLCLDAGAVTRTMTPRVRAILPVHLYGHAADVRGLSAVAESHGVALVEDAAQALGSRLERRALGTWGRAGCFSFFPTKVLGALGDAGLVVTDEPSLAADLRSLRQHGLAGAGRYVRVGGNFRMDAIQAAALSALLPHLDSALRVRRSIAAHYDDALAGIPGLSPCRRDRAVEWNGGLYTVRVREGRRAALQQHLTRSGVETRVYYDVPLHLQPVFEHLGYREGQFPVAERVAKEVLSLPVHPRLKPDDLARVEDAIRTFFGQ